MLGDQHVAEPSPSLSDELPDSASVVELGRIHSQDVGVRGVVERVPPVLSVRDVLLDVKNELPGRILGYDVELFSGDLQAVRMALT